ncbi:MAG: glycosyltransferase family 4 protein [Gemmatimonadetes bacterium]|nr:glycosyltransferase family 4 protein [Gemmatimonadota bacterium]
MHSGNLYGGIESMLATLVRSADKEQLQSSFAVCFDGRLSEELHALGSRVDFLGPARVSRPWTVWRARRRLAALLQQQRPDFAVFHSGWSQAVFGSAVQSARVRVLRWFHAAPQEQHWLDRWARRTSPDLAICNSHFTATAVARTGLSVPQVVVHPPVPPPPPAAASARGRLRGALGVPEGTVVILQVGRMEPGKGHRIMLEALAHLNDRREWVAWQVGGPQREAEVSYVGSLGITAARLGLAGRVRFLGEHTDVRELMCAADIYCQPNVTPESFGITFIEALYAGLPVVTSAIGGASEVVDLTCGALLPPGDPVALADALRVLLADPAARSALGAAGPARARLLCDPARQIERLQQALASRLPA